MAFDQLFKFWTLVKINLTAEFKGHPEKVYLVVKDDKLFKPSYKVRRHLWKSRQEISVELVAKSLFLTNYLQMYLVSWATTSSGSTHDKRSMMHKVRASWVIMMIRTKNKKLHAEMMLKIAAEALTLWLGDFHLGGLVVLSSPLLLILPNSLQSRVPANLSWTQTRVPADTVSSQNPPNISPNKEEIYLQRSSSWTTNESKTCPAF